MFEHVLGELAIYAAFAFNIIAGIAFFAAGRGKVEWETLALRAYRVFCVSVLVAVILLFYLFLSKSYAFKYVYQYSDSSLSLGFLISSFWAGQEGTYLLWLFYNSIFGFLLIKFGRQYRDYAMSVLASINIFFLFILTQLSPFALLQGVPPDGAGLNELLQDYWMVIHPPVMFIGYSMVALPFSIAMAALIRKDFSTWLKVALPWVGVSALALGAGNIMGGFWAYRTLGWGGYWAWDPVENSSFVPWFTALALMHGMIIERRSGALRKTNVLMASFLFLLVVYGTFLTRSGVLADFSVHSFVDLGTTGYLVAFLGFFVLMTLALFIPRIKAMGHVPMSYNFFGREFSLVAATGLLLIFALIVMFWMSLPLTTKLVGMEPRAADLATYNSFALPFGILYALMLAVVPFTTFGEYIPKKWLTRLVSLAGFGLVIGLLPQVFGEADLQYTILTTIVITTMGMYSAKAGLARKLIPAIVAFVVVVVGARLLGVSNYLYLLFFATGAMAVVSNATYMGTFFPDRWKLAGAHITHFGFGILVLGVLASSAFVVNEKLVIPKGEAREAFGMNVAYKGMQHEITFPKNQLMVELGDEGDAEHIRPQLYYSARMDGIMRRPSIRKNWLYDLYFAPEQVVMGEQGHGLRLSRGEAQEVGDFKITFEDFEMGDHGDGGNMSVAARLLVNREEGVDTLMPAVELVNDDQGRARQVNHPAELHGGYKVDIEHILADQGAIVVSIPGLTGGGDPEKLVIDISRLMLVDLVWGGAILVVMGVFVSFLRRRDEIPQS